LEFLDLPFQFSCSRLCFLRPFTPTCSCEVGHQLLHNSAACIAHACHAAGDGLNKSCICRTQLISNGLYSALNGADYILIAAAALDLLALLLSVIGLAFCLPARGARPKGGNPAELLRFLGIDGVLVADPSSSSSVFGLLPGFGSGLLAAAQGNNQMSGLYLILSAWPRI
jgi:hypothetical protein